MGISSRISATINDIYALGETSLEQEPDEKLLLAKEALVRREEELLVRREEELTEKQEALVRRQEKLNKKIIEKAGELREYRIALTAVLEFIKQVAELPSLKFTSDTQGSYPLSETLSEYKKAFSHSYIFQGIELDDTDEQILQDVLETPQKIVFNHLKKNDMALIETIVPCIRTTVPDISDEDLEIRFEKQAKIFLRRINLRANLRAIFKHNIMDDQQNINKIISPKKNETLIKKIPTNLLNEEQSINAVISFKSEKVINLKKLKALHTYYSDLLELVIAAEEKKTKKEHKQLTQVTQQLTAIKKEQKKIKREQETQEIAALDNSKKENAPEKTYTVFEKLNILLRGLIIKIRGEKKKNIEKTEQVITVVQSEYKEQAARATEQTGLAINSIADDYEEFSPQKMKQCWFGTAIEKEREKPKATSTCFPFLFSKKRVKKVSPLVTEESEKKQQKNGNEAVVQTAPQKTH